jgi:RNA polymerase II C-terminal domain phosphatase-like 3/4
MLIVASDGLWEFVSNSEAVAIAARCRTARAAAEALAAEAQARWAGRFDGAHCDDVTVAVAFLA